ncbi:MAG TPA: ArsA-related P-loop ATPase [Actinomycetota bacterium]|nr:ArsA-related P-loop ATPase [Actinomycetota bacterium]
MTLDEFFAPKILIVSGKGGVGKTTVAAALAVLAARGGRKVCIAEVDQKGTLPKLFGGAHPGFTPKEMSPGVWGLKITPEEAMEEYLRVQYHMRRISKVFTSTHFVDYVTTAAPGLKDILVLGKVWYLEEGKAGAAGHRFDTIILDAPAAGHMLTFLSAPMGLSDALRVGPVRKQSDWMIEMLRDPARTRVHLVTLAEEMPVTETIETSEALRTSVGLNEGMVFANAVYTRLFTPTEESRLAKRGELDGELAVAAKAVGVELEEEDIDGLIGYARFLTARRKIQSRHLKKLKAKTEAPVVELPYLFSAGLGLPDIEVLADVIQRGIEETDA